MVGRAKCFEILGVRPDASYEQVKKSYRQLVKEWHPDRFFAQPEWQSLAHRKLSDINGAYAVLSEWFEADATGRGSASSGLRGGASAAPDTARRAAGGAASGGVHQERTTRQARAWEDDESGLGETSAAFARSDRSAPEGRASEPGLETVWRYLRAAEQGFDHAQFELGLLYFHGRGVARDWVEAYKWLALAAAAQGRVHLMADHYLARLQAGLSREQVAEAHRRMAPYSNSHAYGTSRTR